MKIKKITKYWSIHIEMKKKLDFIIKHRKESRGRKMRNIKFRGKDILYKSWKHGSLVKDKPQKMHYIIDNENGRVIEVNEETIGQYTDNITISIVC